MNQDVNILVDINDSDLESPFSIVITYYDGDPKGNEPSSVLSYDLFHVYEDPEEAFKDWGSIMPPQNKIDHLRARFDVVDIYVEILLYDAHNCEIAVTNFKWSDHA